MFLNRLTRAQREAFMSLAREMAAIDGVSALGEVRTLARLEREMGFTPGDTLQLFPLDVAATRFDSRSSQMIALFELMTLGYADRSYSAMESAMVRRLGGAWRLKREEVAKVEELVLRQRTFIEEVIQFFGGD